MEQAPIPRNCLVPRRPAASPWLLSLNLEKAGHPPKRISTTAKVKLEASSGGFKITTIELQTKADVPGIDDKQFQEQAELTKKTCPVSVALSGTEIKLNAELETS